MHERVPAMSLAVGEQTGASRRASSGLHGAPVLYSTRTSCWRPWRRMVVRSSLRARLSATTGRLFCAWDGGLTIEEWIWPGTQATGPCHGARPWRTVCAEINDDRTEFKYIREDQGQISTASLVAMQTDTTVQSLDLKFSYFGRGGQPLREKERLDSGVLMRRILLHHADVPTPGRYCGSQQGHKRRMLS